MIVTCGEAIVDLVPESDGAGEIVFRPVLGGSPFNVALGVGRLGGRAAFLWEVSSDQFGPAFRSALAEAGVELSLTRASGRASPVAVVDLSREEPVYRIADPDQVMATFDPGAAEALDGARLFHTGSAILALEPVGARLEALVGAIADRCAVSLDLNVRPPSVSDWAGYRARLARLEERAAIMKASEVDLRHLHGPQPADAHLDRWLAAGVALAIVTRGAAGAVAATPRARVAVPALEVVVADPVGAGDAMMAGVLAFLDRHRLLSRAALAGMGREALRQALEEGCRAAAWCCRHRGGRMPYKSDVAALAGALS